MSITLFFATFAIFGFLLLACVVVSLNKTKKDMQSFASTLMETTAELLATPADDSGEEIITLKQKVELLKKTERDAKERLENLKGDHKREKMEMEFLISKQEERTEIDKDRMAVDVEKKTATMEKDLQAEYFKKTEKLLGEFRKEMKETTDRIMGLVPKINASFEKKDINKTNG